MTFFDLIVVLLLFVSGLVGFIRGFTREVITVAAFVIAALVAVFALRFTGPIARGAFEFPWMGNAAAILVVFIAVYILTRVAGAGLTKRIHQAKALGTVDRVAGVGVGLVRALVLLGVFHLVVHAATPETWLPGWMTRSAFYPVSKAAAGGLRVVAREGAGKADGLGPALRDAVVDGRSPGQAESTDVELADTATATDMPAERAR